MLIFHANFATVSTPTSELTTLELSVPLAETGNDVFGELTVGDERVTGSPREIITAVERAVERHEPDVLVCSTSEIIPTLYEMAAVAGHTEFTLSRWPDIEYQQLASQSTYSSYGQLGHTPAPCHIPGRAISN